MYIFRKNFYIYYLARYPVIKQVGYPVIQPAGYPVIQPAEYPVSGKIIGRISVSGTTLILFHLPDIQYLAKLLAGYPANPVKPIDIDVYFPAGLVGSVPVEESGEEEFGGLLPLHPPQNMQNKRKIIKIIKLKIKLGIKFVLTLIH